MTIEELISGPFENKLSSNQSLTFDYLSGVLIDKKLKFDDEFVNKFRIPDNDENRNIGYMLSDQFRESIKVAVFSDENKRTIADRVDCKGCVIEQFDTAWKFVLMQILNHPEHQEGFAKESLHFPVEAVREALVNAIIHRDYHSKSCTLVSILPNKIVITSPGSTDWEYSVDELISGICSSRNPILVSVFKLLGLAEVYGSGIARIFGHYPDSMKPQIHMGKSLFSITLPLVMSEPSVRQTFTRSDIENRGMSRNESINYINSLIKSGKVERIGGGRSTRYVFV